MSRDRGPAVRSSADSYTCLMPHTRPDELNPEQQRAVRWGLGEDTGPVIVLAGPGTGKTRVIVRRIAYLIEEAHEDPSCIAAVTFTNKAAGEMRGRLVGLLGPRAERVFIGTIHSMARRILDRFGDRLGLSSRVELPDSAQRRRLSRRLARQHSLFRASLGHGLDGAIARAWAMIDVMQQHALDAPRAVEVARRDLHELLTRGPRPEDPTGQEHEARLAEARELLDVCLLYQFAGQDFLARQLVAHDDSIALARRVLDEHADAAAIMRSQWRHIIVDEFQDTNAAQLELLRAISPPGSASAALMVVGDDDQSIYSFRGADERIFHRFAAAWKNHTVVKLSRNYRSDPRIVTACNAVIASAHARFDAGKVIVPGSGRRGAGAVCVELSSDDRDASAIIALIRRERERNPGRSLESFAILALKHDHLDRYALALELEGIPSVRRRAGPVLSDAGVQDVLAWMRLLCDRGADWAVCRLLSRGFGVRLEEASAWRESWRRREDRRAMDGQSPRSFFDELAEQWGGEARVARFLTLHAALSEIASRSDAAGTIQAIIRESGAATRELLPARERSRRVAALVRVLKFARERLDRLDQPRDVASFLAYYDDLDPSEQQFASLRDSPNEEELDDEETGGGVQLLTIFAAKGLEFETVFVPRVNPGSNFPSLRGRDRAVELPESFIDRAGDVRSAEERIYDEFRRLFYVACTRAESSLYVLSKVNKKRSGSVNFFEELRFAEPPVVSVMSESDLLGPAASAGVARMTGAPAADVARAEARALAAMALDAIDRPDVRSDEIDAVGISLTDAAARLALAAHVRAGGTIPAWAGERGLSDAAAELLRRGASRGRMVPKPPLELSYSKLDSYERCPACFYLRHVLRLPEEPRRETRLGTVVHDTLDKFVGLLRSAEGEGRPAPSIAVLKQIGREMLLRDQPDAGADDVRALEALLDSYSDRFHDANAETLETERTVHFDFEHAGVTHRMTAKIDRIDRMPRGFRIIDYKTGGAWKELREPPRTDLQMGIYAMALTELYPDAPLEGTAEYWLLASGQRGVIGLDALELPKIRAKIGKLIDGILAGEFDAKKNCEGPCGTFGLGVSD